MKKENLARGVSTQYPILHARLKTTIEQNTTKRLSPNFAFNIKGKPSRPRQFLVTERPLKMMQTFYFERFFVLMVFKILS